jgi:hypothetical protein
MTNKFQNSILKKFKIKSAAGFGDFEFWNLFVFWPFCRLLFLLNSQT